MYNPPKIIGNPQMPIALIAGGAGFLGSHLAEYLLSKNFRVVVVDNLESGRREFVAHLLAHPRFGFIEYDLNLGLPENVTSVDAIFHLLGNRPKPQGDLTGSLNSLLTNSLSTYHLLELTKSCQAKFLLASSLDVYQGIASASELSNYFGPTESDQRVFSYNESKRYAESLAWEYFKKYSLDLRVARLPEVYGPRMDFAASGRLGRLLENTLEGKDLVVEGDGLDANFYLFVSDGVEALYEALVRPGTTGKIFSLCQSPAVAQLELAYLLKSLALPGTQIVFRPTSERTYDHDQKNVDRKNLKLIGFKQKIKIREGLKMTLNFLGFSNSPDAKIEPTDQSWPGETAPKLPEGIFDRKLSDRPSQSFLAGWGPRLKSQKKKVISYGVGCLFLFFSPFIFVPVVSLAYHSVRALADFQNLESRLKKSDLEKALAFSQSLGKNLTESQTDLGHLFLPRSFKRPYLKSLRAGAELSLALGNLIDAVRPQLDYLSSLPGSERSPGSPIGYPYLKAEDSLAFINQALDQVSLAEAEIKDASLTTPPSLLRAPVERIKSTIGPAKNWGQVLRGLISVTPDLLGFDRAKNYLVLLQNSNELRPTGGFIGALVKIKVDGGRIENPEVEDIYNLDSKIDQSEILIFAPKVLKDSLQTDRLHLRDANFDISFPASANKFRRLYRQATGVAADGIIAIDLDFVRLVLKALGPVFLTTYNEEVSGDNLFEKVQFHSEAGFAPGGNGKKTFLSVLSAKILENLITARRESYLPLTKSMLTAVAEKHLLAEFYFNRAAALAGLDLDGEVKESEGDFLSVVDTNIGANKANYFVKRSLAYEAERGNRVGEVNSTLTLNYQHRGTSDAWPGGPYKNFLRILVPLKASLIKVKKIDHAASEGEAPPVDQEEDLTNRILIDEESGKTSFGLTFELPSGRRTEIVFSYVLPPAVFFLNSSSYNLLIQKQPGTSGDSLRAKFILPFGKNLEEELPQGFTRQGTSVIYEGSLRKDLEIKIPLSPK